LRVAADTTALPLSDSDRSVVFAAMADSPQFSVIVPTFNRPKLLADALESVAHQTVPDFECLVVNDGESDVSLPDDERFVLIDKREGGGFAAALNTAIKEARGRYITFLDDDDAYTPQRLELAQRGMETSPVAVCWRANYDTGIPGKNRNLEGWVNDVILDRSPPMAGQTTVERERIVPFDETFRNVADIEWWIRLTRVLPVTTTPEVGLLFRRHPERTTLDYQGRFMHRIRLYEKHADYFRTHPRAAARFHMRTGIFADKAGHRSVARRQLWLAAKAARGPRPLYYLVRTFVPTRPR
jgi:glycosyltransferase involved in cell wall biosynthesis